LRQFVQPERLVTRAGRGDSLLTFPLPGGIIHFLPVDSFRRAFFVVEQFRHDDECSMSTPDRHKKAMLGSKGAKKVASFPVLAFSGNDRIYGARHEP
jgi:hypothetical protein